jgi:MFS family permease
MEKSLAPGSETATGSGPASIAAIRAALLTGREPPAAQVFARAPSYRWLVVGTVCIGAFMGQVDSSITQLLLPRLESEFNAQLSTVSWVAVAYLLAMAAFLPIFGRLADILGRKLLYTGGFLLFVLSSGLCGLAPNLPVLIAFRVIQGIGGLVLDVLDWRWVFFINVPVGLAGTIMGWFVLPPTRDLPADARFDWNGALLIAPALTAVMVVLNEGYAWGATSPLLLGAALLAAILLVLFVRCERSADAPLIDLALFRKRAFALGNIAGLLSYAALFGLFFLMPFIFVRAYHDSILAAGLRLCIVPVLIGVAAPVGGVLYDKLGARAPTVVGMLIGVAGLVMLGTVLDGARDGLPLVMLALALFGVGQGLFVSPNNSTIVAAAPASLTGEAGGFLNVTRACGVSVGVAAASSLLAWRLAVLTGSGHNTLHAGVHDLISAGRDVIVLLASFAAVAGALSFAQAPSEPS